jgi:RNA polymerase sigma-70 factor (ECF subfamily)
MTAATHTGETASHAALIDLNQLCRAHRSKLKSFVRRYVQCEADAEDVVQCTFVEAARCAGSFTARSQPSTWLYGIARNLALNLVRRRSQDADTVDVEDVAHLLEAPDSDPAALVERRDLADKALAMLRSMDPELRRTFNAVYESGNTYVLAAKELGIPTGTVRSRLARIRQEVRQLKGGG